MTYSMYQERVLLYRTLLSFLPLPTPLLRSQLIGCMSATLCNRQCFTGFMCLNSMAHHGR